jgi:mono/diheme cytochrome c family protein
MNRTLSTVALATLAVVAASGALARAVAPAWSDPADSGVPVATDEAVVARGAYLVQTMGCNDCHTPMKMGPRGPEPDMTRALTGHPQELVMPPAPTLPEGPWIALMAATNTAFAGPWGTSFAANLTPDKETGLGNWTYDMFIATMKTGRHQGKGRPILPPMPRQIIAAADDSEARAIFAYLQSLPPVHNRVPAPVDPPEQK